MDAHLTLVHLLCATAAFALAAWLSAPVGAPRARPWLAGAAFALAFAELYAASWTAGFTLRWPWLHVLGAPWPVLAPALLGGHLRTSERRAGAAPRWRHRHA